ncbi:MAG: hypothetical protein ACFB4J_05240 [Elainellaceae cyanobacterium]
MVYPHKTQGVFRLSRRRAAVQSARDSAIQRYGDRLPQCEIDQCEVDQREVDDQAIAPCGGTA